MTKLQAIEGFLFDLDHTMYKEPSNRAALFREAAVLTGMETARRKGLTLDFNEASQAVDRSLKFHGYELTLFAQEHNFNYEDLFHLYHVMAFDLFDGQKAFQPDDEVNQEIEDVTQGKGVILTHGARYWADRVTERLGMLGLFQDKILAHNDPAIGYKRKDKDAHPFLTAVKALNLPVEKLVMVEDTARNLVIPHQMGMTTVLLSWDQPAPQDLPHVDYHFDTLLSFLTAVRKSRNGAAPSP